jgi:hypothetical protein
MRSLSFLPFAGMVLLSSAEAVDFKEEIRPILNKKCFKCHTGPKAKGALRMDVNDDFAKRIGGDDPVIIAGDPAKSLLSVKAGLPASDGDAMPPPPSRDRGAEPMSASELTLVRQWITEGARLEAGGTGAAPATPSVPAPGAAPMVAEIRTWSNSGGGSLKASFVALNGANVTLRKEDGTQFDYPLANLSAESQALAKQLGGQ